MANVRNETAVEDYLKAIFNLGEWDPEGRANANVAARLGVSTSSVSEMLRKLVELGLVNHEPYGRIELTETGRTRAVDMVRRHRLIETYLVRALGYSWDEVHADAEILEHAVSALLMARMDAALGHPWRDPHGDPIPGVDGVLHQPRARALAALEPGEDGYVSRMIDDDSRLLRWFSEQGITLDTYLTVREQKPFGGPLVVDVSDGDSVELGLQAVAAIWVADHAPTMTERETAEPACPYPDCSHRDQM